MRIDFIGKSEEQYLRNCIRTCQKKNHIQQVVFSTYHDCLTQICFTCNCLRTSLSQEEVRGTKKGNQPLDKNLSQQVKPITASPGEKKLENGIEGDKDSASINRNPKTADAIVSINSKEKSW